MAMAILVAAAAWAVLRDPVLTFEGSATFVGRKVCAECHEKETERWQGSHHDLAMDHARPDTVRGDFGDVTFTHQGVTSRFWRDGEHYLVRTDGPDGALTEYEVKYVFGYEPLQQYLVDGENGRLQVLHLCWDTEEQRWFHLYDEPIAHEDALHWTGRHFTWNFMCAECHSTDLQRRYAPDTDTYDTTWFEIDVSCEACHGPGSHHETWARKGEDPRVASMGLEVQFKGKEANLEIEHCARCHSRREQLTDAYVYGRPLLDQYAPRLLVEPLYHADGQILDEVYVYGSFLQSKMHAEGVRCSDCHDPHSGRLKHEGDKVCTQCHSEEGDERFPKLRKAKYDDVKHHFHPDETKPGRACVGCHMEARTYMQVDPRRDHSFRIPRPDLTERIGTPNACNTCHKDKTSAWSVAEIGKHLPDFLTGRITAPHFGEAFAQARAGDPQSFEALASMATDVEGVRPIVRATSVEYLGRFRSPEAIRALAPALEDPDGLVRATAAAAIGGYVPAQAPAPLLAQKAKVLAPLLQDPLLLVRTEAARALAGGAEALLDDSAAFKSALAELLARYDAQAERPEAQVTLGALHEARGRRVEAEAAYLRALAIDIRFVPARFNLATLLNGLGRNDEAERQLRAVTKQEPDNGQAWYSLGLLLSEMQKPAEALSALAHAARRLPEDARVHYNYGAALLAAGSIPEADTVLSKAHRLDPRDPDVLRALIGLASRRGDASRARALAQKLRALPLR